MVDILGRYKNLVKRNIFFNYCQHEQLPSDLLVSLHDWSKSSRHYLKRKLLMLEYLLSSEVYLLCFAKQ